MDARTIYKIGFWFLGILAGLSFVCGFIFQEIGMLQDMNWLFIAGWAGGAIGLLILFGIYRIHMKVRFVIDNKEEIKGFVKDVKREIKQHGQDNKFSDEPLIVQIIGWFLLIPIAGVIISIPWIVVTQGSVFSLVLFGVCFGTILLLGIPSGLISARHKENKRIAEQAAKARAKRERQERKKAQQQEQVQAPDTNFEDPQAGMN